MKILVSDTSVLIDLERGNFLESCFKLPFEFAVPDLLYNRELAEFGGPRLVELGLRVEELSGGEVTTAQIVRRTRPRLSLVDSFAYALASARGWTLLTGDGELRAVAKVENVPVFGVLWVIDQLFDGAVMEADAVATGLEAIAAHPRCRLPPPEIQVRLARYWRRGE
jgi:predicted nucleic acid-binding protein